MEKSLFEKEMNNFMNQIRKSAITNTLAVLMAMDGDDLTKTIERQDVNKVYNMIYKEEEDEQDE
jgi:hypothetical protein